MAVTITPLGFKKPDGQELVRGGDNIIADNAQAAQDRINEDRGRLAQLESAAGFPGTGIDLSDAVVAPLITGDTQTRANLDARYAGASDTGYAQLPAGVQLIVIKGADGKWPGGTASTGVRPTSRTDLPVEWRGPDPSPAFETNGTNGMVAGVDTRAVTS